MSLETILQLILAVIAGAIAGAYGYYRYVNYIFMRYPEFLKLVLQRKQDRQVARQAAKIAKGVERAGKQEH